MTTTPSMPSTGDPCDGRPPIDAHGRLRPTFELILPLEPSDAIDRLGSLVRPGSGLVGRAVGNHASVTVPAGDRHFWSPHLSAEVVAHEKGCLVHARFHPHPNIWTAYMLGYLALLVLASVAVAFGFAQWWIDLPPTGLYGLAVVGPIGLIMWRAAFVGQRLARSQMCQLRSALEAALDARREPGSPSAA